MLKFFKGRVLYLFVGLMIERCSGLQMVGSCTFQVYVDKARECTTAFITNLQTDKSVDCKVIYNKMVECTKDYVRECVKNRVPPKDIEAFLSEAAKKLRSEDFYCKDGLFSPPVLTNEQKKEIPCNETFYDESRVCGDTFQTKFRSNRADKTLCKEFSNAKSCLKDAVTQHCTFDADARELLQSAFDGYNPFCNISSGEGGEKEEGGYSIPDGNEEELDAIGQCSVVRQLNRTRQCITLFIKSLQADPQGNCSVKYIHMQDCIVCVLRSCLESYGIIADSVIEVQLEQSRNQTHPEEFYCRGMLEAPKVSSNYEHLPCDPGFSEKEAKCMKEFNDTFTANVSDASLCSKFRDAKLCLRDLITNNCASDARQSLLEFAIVFDDYNPFCQGSRDQDESSLSAEEFNEPCLSEFPTAGRLLSSKGTSLIHSFYLLFFISSFLVET